ncbi:MAG: alpha/beta hydrolase [Pseudomonadota bacterium]
MWLVLIVGIVIAVPLILERNRREMDDAARGAGPGQFATLPQGVTHFTWSGPKDGPVVICIHGLTTPSFVWQGLVKGLTAAGFRVLTYDLYGRGYSDRPRGKQDAAFFLRQLSDLMTHEEVRGRVTLIGYSMGGAIATCYAAANPTRLRQLVLIAPAGMQHAIGAPVRVIRDSGLIGSWLMHAAFPRLHRKGIAAERALPASVLDIYDQQEAELEFKGFIAAVLSSLRGVLRRPLKVEHQTIARKGLPVLAIWGAEDSVIPIKAVGRLAEWNRGAEHEQIACAGHGLTYTHTDDVLGCLVPRLMKD